MRSTFFGLEIGRKALQSQTTALDVTGHNIANANTEGYTRQRAVMTTPTPFAYPSINKPTGAGQVGTGVKIEEIKRLRDGFIDSQMRKENSVTGYWESCKNALDKLEVIINEPTDSGLRTVLDQFWESWQTLATRPEERSVRSTVVQRGMAVAETFQHMSQQLVDLQDDLNRAVDLKVDEINNIAYQITGLNEQIVTIESSGDHANDLRDKRDLLVDQLAKIVNINYREDQFGAVSIAVGIRTLVTGKNYTRMETYVPVPTTTGFYALRWEDGISVNLTSGELQGLINSRDTIAQSQLDQLNTLATTYITKFNDQHQLGFGLNAAAYVPGEAATAAVLTADGAVTSLDFSIPQDLVLTIDGGAPVTITLNKDYTGKRPELLSAINTALGGAATASFDGSNLKITNNSTGATSTIAVGGLAGTTLGLTSGTNVPGTDAASAVLTANNPPTDLDFSTTPQDIIVTIDGGTPVTITLNADYSGNMAQLVTDINTALDGALGAGAAVASDAGGNVQITSGSQGANSAVSVSGRGGALLFGSGHLFFAGNDASDIEVDASTGNLDNIAAALSVPAGHGDNTNALALNALKHDDTAMGSSTFDDYFRAVAAQLGIDSQAATRMVNNQDLLVSQLNAQQQKVSGVSLDEEMTNMIKFQHAYNAASRVITTMDEMLDTIILRMGLAGR